MLNQLRVLVLLLLVPSTAMAYTVSLLPNTVGTPYHVIDDSWISDFDAWKGWADVNLSTRASQATLSAFQSANHTDTTQVDTDLLSFKSANHTDTAQVGSDVVSFQSANHTDTTQVDTDLLSFKSANHTDTTQVDTDVVGFKSANHTDMTAVQANQLNSSIALETTAGEAFTTALNSASLSGTTEVALLYFVNPSGSGKSAVFYSMAFSPTLGNNYVTYRVYRDATVTANGSALTVSGGRSSSQNSTVVSVYSGPTVTSNGTLIYHSIASGLSGNDSHWKTDFSFYVEANHNLLITRQLSANATAGGVDMTWVEK